MDVVAGDDGMVGAAMEEQARVNAVAYMVVPDPNVVAALGRDDAVITFQRKRRIGIIHITHATAAVTRGKVAA